MVDSTSGAAAILGGASKLNIQPYDALKTQQEIENLKSTQLSNQRSQNALSDEHRYSLVQQFAAVSGLPDSEQDPAKYHQIIDNAVKQNPQLASAAQIYHNLVTQAGSDPAALKRVGQLAMVGTLSGPQAAGFIFGQKLQYDDGQHTHFGYINPFNQEPTWTQSVESNKMTNAERDRPRDYTTSSGQQGTVTTGTVVDSAKGGRPLPGVTPDGGTDLGSQSGGYPRAAQPAPATGAPAATGATAPATGTPAPASAPAPATGGRFTPPPTFNPPPSSDAPATLAPPAATPGPQTSNAPVSDMEIPGPFGQLAAAGNTVAPAAYVQGQGGPVQSATPGPVQSATPGPVQSATPGPVIAASPGPVQVGSGNRLMNPGMSLSGPSPDQAAQNAARAAQSAQPIQAQTKYQQDSTDAYESLVKSQGDRLQTINAFKQLSDASYLTITGTGADRVQSIRGNLTTLAQSIGLGVPPDWNEQNIASAILQKSTIRAALTSPGAGQALGYLENIAKGTPNINMPPTALREVAAQLAGIHMRDEFLMQVSKGPTLFDNQKWVNTNMDPAAFSFPLLSKQERSDYINRMIDESKNPKNPLGALLLKRFDTTLGMMETYKILPPGYFTSNTLLPPGTPNPETQPSSLPRGGPLAVPVR